MITSEQSERAEIFAFFRQKHTFFVNSLLVNHILVNATCPSIRNTHNIILKEFHKLLRASGAG